MFKSLSFLNNLSTTSSKDTKDSPCLKKMTKMKDLSTLKNHVIIALKPRMEVQGNGIFKVKENSPMSARSTHLNITTPRHEYENPETY